MIVGQLQIVGEFDDKDINRGFNNIEKHQDDVKRKNQGMIGDFTRLSSVTRTVATGFLSIGASTLAVARFAKDTPALAGSMASIGVSMQRIKFAIGEGLQAPMEVMSGLLQSIAEFGASDPQLFTGLTILGGFLGLDIAAKAIHMGSLSKAFGTIGFTGGAIAGLTILAGLLASRNWDTMGKGIDKIKSWSTEEGRVQTTSEFSSLSEGGFVSDLFQGFLMFGSPIWELIGGTDPYTPTGYRNQGEFVQSGRGVDFVRTQQNQTMNTRDIVLGQGDMTP